MSAPGGSAAQPPRWLVLVVSGGFFVLLTYVLIQHVRTHLSHIFAVSVIALGIVCIALAADRLLARSEWPSSRRRVGLVAGFLVVFAVQLLFVREIYGTMGWDPKCVFAAAIKISGFKESALAVHAPQEYMFGFPVGYWGAYPNNLPLAFIYETIFRLCAALGIPNAVFLSTALNVLVVDLAIILAFVCARMLWGPRTGRITLLIAVPFLGFSPWISIAYSDTMATVFPVLLLYLYLRYVKATHAAQYVYAAAIGAVSAAGYLIKPHVIAMTLSIGLIHGICRGTLGSPLASKLLKLGVFVLAALVILSGFGAYRDYRLRDRLPRQQLEELRFPVSHFIAMSLNDEYGGYNQPDVDAQRALPGVAAKNERNLRVIKDRLRELGVLGYLRFVHKKLTWMTTDGTFHWQREGALSECVAFHDGRYAQVVQSLLYRSGFRFHWFERVANAAWLALVVLMIAPALSSRRLDSDRALLIMRAAAIILLLMLLVLEGRSRYLISFVPIFVLLSAYYLGGLRPGATVPSRAPGP